MKATAGAEGENTHGLREESKIDRCKGASISALPRRVRRDAGAAHAALSRLFAA